MSVAEAIATSRRIADLEREGLPGSFDRKQLQSIHRSIFQDVFAWAGELRTVTISRSGQMPFALPHMIVPCLDDLSKRLSSERWLGSCNLARFLARSAFFMGELNAIHPFREGNGRTQREFVRQLAHRNGFILDWSRVGRDEMRDAFRLSILRGDNSGLEKMLTAAIG